MTKKISERIYDIMARDDYQPDMVFCEQMANECRDNKQNLIEVLRNHPQWDEENLRIHFKADIERSQDTRLARQKLCELCDFIMNAVYTKRRSLRAKVNRIGNQWSGVDTIEVSAVDFFNDPDAVETYKSLSEEMVQVDLFYNIGVTIYSKADFFIQTYIPDEAVAAVTNKMAGESGYLPSEVIPKLRLHKGQKATKAAWGLLQQFGFDTLLSPEQKSDGLRLYSQYTDAMNPITVERHTVLSVNPVDFMQMSNGNSWSSCHHIGTGYREHGGWAAGSFSYAYDTQTMIFYTVDGRIADEDVEAVPKITRQVVFWNGMTLLGSRVYPQEWDGDNQMYAQHRQIVEKIMADALGAPNFWRKVPQECIDYRTNGFHYRDYECHNYPAYEIIGREPEDPEHATRHFDIGSNQPICLCCGDYLDEESYPVCSSCEERNRQACADCGEMFDEDDLYEVIDSDGDAIFVCRDCRDNSYCYCDYDEQYHPDDECTYIDHFGYVYDGDLENSEDFAKCEDCGDWVYIGYGSEGYTEVEDFGFVCSDCLEKDDYFQCADCGEWFTRVDNEYIDDLNGDPLCESCYQARLESRNAEQTEHTEEEVAA